MDQSSSWKLAIRVMMRQSRRRRQPGVQARPKPGPTRPDKLSDSDTSGLGVLVSDSEPAVTAAAGGPAPLGRP